VTFVDWADMHKWSLINKGLDFGQPEPVETYSSSPHLFTDLDIPQGVKGRLKPSPAAPHAERAPREGSSRPPRQRTRSGSGGGEAARAEGGGTHDGATPARRKRTRRRRGGSGGGTTTAPPAA
jgi:hypothetical protein